MSRAPEVPTAHGLCQAFCAASMVPGAPSTPLWRRWSEWVCESCRDARDAHDAKRAAGGPTRQAA